MSRILAIDWDRLEARAVVVHSGPTGSSVVGGWVVPLSSSEGTTPTAEQVGRQLAVALRDHVAGNVTTLVAVGRDHVQMKLLSLPPAPADELPDLVRFQAEREFTTLGDDAALDFIPLVGDATTPHQVLAAALASRGVNEVNLLCKSLGLEPGRITMRGAAAASLVARSVPAGDSEVALVVHRLADEADLIALVGGQVVLVRTVRMPAAGEVAARSHALAGEIRRTTAAVRQQLVDRSVEKVVFCGTAIDAPEAAALAREIELPVDVFDVAAHAPAGLRGAGVSDEGIGHMAAVLGMALTEADRRPPVVDFLNVRRRVTARRFARVHALAAATLIVAALGVIFYLWRQAATPRWELLAVNAELAGLEGQGNQFAEVVARADAVDRWSANDVNWLAELERLSRAWRPELLSSEEFAVADDVVATRLIAIAPQGAEGRGGFFDLQAVAKSSAAVAPLEQRLRDEEHRVSAGGGKQDRTVPGYEWSFGMRVDVPPQGDAEGEAQ